MKIFNKNRSCLVCNKKYEFCPTGCKKSINKPSWMGMFHSENCRNIYYTCSNYMVGKSITKEQAKEELEKLDLSNIDKQDFNPRIREWVKEIIGDSKATNVDLEEEPKIEFENELNDEEPVG